MSPSGSFQRPDAIVRAAFATATVIFGGIGLLVRDARLLVASGIFGILWTLWDVLWGRWIEPASTWAFRVLTEGAGGPPPNIRPTLDDTIRLLESHLAGDASRHVQIQAALRLEEIYRAIRKDPDRAAEVLARARARFPDAEELRARASDVHDAVE